MQAKVPQDIFIEDKIIGPFGPKDLIVLFIFAGIALTMYTFLEPSNILNWIEMGTVVAMGFAWVLFKPFDMPFERFLLSGFSYSVKAKSRIWWKVPLKIKIVEDTALKYEDRKVEDKFLDSDKVSELSKILDTRGYAGSGLSLKKAGGESDDYKFVNVATSQSPVSAYGELKDSDQFAKISSSVNIVEGGKRLDPALGVLENTRVVDADAVELFSGFEASAKDLKESAAEEPPLTTNFISLESILKNNASLAQAKSQVLTKQSKQSLPESVDVLDQTESLKADAPQGDFTLDQQVVENRSLATDGKKVTIGVDDLSFLDAIDVPSVKSEPKASFDIDALKLEAEKSSSAKAGSKQESKGGGSAAVEKTKGQSQSKDIFGGDDGSDLTINLKF